jgi:hypothetical protein
MLGLESFRIALALIIEGLSIDKESLIDEQLWYILLEMSVFFFFFFLFFFFLLLDNFLQTSF